MRMSDWSSDVCSSDLPAPASLLTNPCASAVDLNGPVSTRLVALSGVHQPCLPFINAGALSTTRAKARASMASLAPPATWTQRSEEHTSELQSLMRISYAVFCLKKKI